MACKPIRSILDHCLERPGLGKQMARPRDDLERFGSRQPRQRLLIELDDAEVGTADDQKRWRLHVCRAHPQPGRVAHPVRPPHQHGEEASLQRQAPRPLRYLRRTVRAEAWRPMLGRRASGRRRQAGRRAAGYRKRWRGPLPLQGSKDRTIASQSLDHSMHGPQTYCADSNGLSRCHARRRRAHKSSLVSAEFQRARAAQCGHRGFRAHFLHHFLGKPWGGKVHNNTINSAGNTTERRQHLGRRHRQIAHTHADRVVDSIGDRCGCRDGRRLANPACIRRADRLIIFEQMTSIEASRSRQRACTARGPH